MSEEYFKYKNKYSPPKSVYIVNEKGETIYTNVLQWKVDINNSFNFSKEDIKRDFEKITVDQYIAYKLKG